MKLFDCFEEHKTLIDETEFVNVYSVKCDEKEYTVIIPKKAANKNTIIQFIDNTVFWVQVPMLPRLGGQGYRRALYKFVGDKQMNTLFVVKGEPRGDEGLDSGIFRSHRKYDENYVNCMTYKYFKKM